MNEIKLFFIFVLSLSFNTYANAHDSFVEHDKNINLSKLYIKNIKDNFPNSKIEKYKSNCLTEKNKEEEDDCLKRLFINDAFKDGFSNGFKSAGADDKYLSLAKDVFYIEQSDYSAFISNYKETYKEDPQIWNFDRVDDTIDNLYKNLTLEKLIEKSYSAGYAAGFYAYKENIYSYRLR